MRIDVHAHYYPPELVDAYSRLKRMSGNPQRAPAGRVPLDERLDLLAEAGIDLQILCSGANQPYVDNRQEAVAVARLANDLYADVCKAHRRFAAFATLPLPHIDAAINEMGRCLTRLACWGSTLAPRWQAVRWMIHCSDRCLPSSSVGVRCFSSIPKGQAPVPWPTPMA